MALSPRQTLARRIADRLTGFALPPRTHGGRIQLSDTDAAAVAEVATEDYDAAMVAMSAAAAEARQHAINGWVAWVKDTDPTKCANETVGERRMFYEDHGFPEWLSDGIEQKLAHDYVLGELQRVDDALRALHRRRPRVQRIL